MKNPIYLFKQSLRISFLLIVGLLGNATSLDAQETTPYEKNSVFVTYGNVIFTSQFSASYERLVYQKEKLRAKIKINYGKYLGNNADHDTDAKVYENYKTLSGVYLDGTFEFNLGVALTEYKLASGPEPDPLKDYDEILSSTEIYGNIGLRYDKEGLIMRVGIGNLELLYASIGFSF